MLLASVVSLAGSAAWSVPADQVCSSQGSNGDFKQEGCIAQNGSQAEIRVGAKTRYAGTPASQTPDSPPAAPAKTQAKTEPPAPPPPPCGYYALTPEELASPWAWAGAEQADTGTLIPGRFLTTNSGFVEAGIPADKAGLGVQPYWYRCDGQQRLVFVPTPVPPTPRNSNPTPGTQPGIPSVEVAQHLEGEIHLPGMAVGLNPAQFGITGFESYFWVAGYDCQPILQPATGTPGTSGWLRATPTYYRWSFGDGYSVTTTSLGQAYPKVSAITHTYDVRSDWSPMAAPTTVTTFR